MKPQPLKLLTAAIAMSVALISSSWAVVLQVPPTQTELGAILSSTSFQTAGTGVIDPFLRVQANGTETGFNSSGAPQGDAKNGPFTRDLLISSLQSRNVSGVDYYQFSLDINQNQSTDASGNIIMTMFDLYTGTQANRTNLSGATLRFSLLNDYQIADINSGSGAGDFQILVPVSVFAAIGGDTLLTLNVTFTQTNDGIEEWNALQGPNEPTHQVPDGGSTIMLLGAALGGLGAMRRFVRR